MIAQHNDTIAAIATPPGFGGVGIVRISGLLSRPIAQAMLGRLPLPRQAEYLRFLDANGDLIDAGIALFFPSPHSFTGEDVLELQGHGGPVVLDMLLRRGVELGARLAQPGEFSQRAFLNGKLDLIQAEAIADLIASSSVQAARSATRSLEGEFSEAINTLVARLIELRMYVESAIDFPDEEIDFLTEGGVAARLDSLLARLADIQATAHQGRLLREGMTVVIAGLPNAGKSSLLNRLAARDAAIVTDIPGTTRDVLREHINIDGLPLHVVDTAGLRETQDVVEQHGVQRAWDEIRRADRILLVVDDHADIQTSINAILRRLPSDITFTLVRNKIDLTGRLAGLSNGPQGIEIAVSAQTGHGIAELRNHLKESVGYSSAGEGHFIARRRHIDALLRAHQHLANGRRQLEHHAGELLAEDLRLAQNALSEITGQFTSDDLLGQIFSSFCIGK